MENLENPGMPNGVLIKKLSEMMKQGANIALQHDDLTHAQAHLLGVLHRHSGTFLTLKELEARLSLAQSTVVGLVDRLEKKQLVETFRDTDDRRVKRIRLTSAGMAHCEVAFKGAEIVEARLVSGMSPEEQEQFHILLEKAFNSMKAGIDQLKGGKPSC